MRPRIIVLHGLNNTTDSFRPLSEELEKHGFECRRMALPGHGELREECRSFKKAFQRFDQDIRSLIQEPYVVLAFSTGAPYLQLWLEKNVAPRPKAQILLAPALFPIRQNIIQRLLKLLPKQLFIPAQTPPLLRRYRGLFVWEYRTLFECIEKYQSLKFPFKIPTQVIVDKKDELIGHDILKAELEARNPSGFELILLERVYLKGRRPGKYHILFHPDYFQDEWSGFIAGIADFFKNHL